MPGKSPQIRLTEAEKKRILVLHAQGMTRNDISRLVCRSPGSVSTVVADAGMTFARSDEVAAATEARRQDLEALRVETAYRLHIDADRLREQIWVPGVVYAFGGRDNVYTEHSVEEPPPADKRALATAAAALLDRSMKLCPPTTGSAEEEGRDLITSLMAGLKAVARDQEGKTEGA
jgi:hypothetical protein